MATVLGAAMAISVASFARAAADVVPHTEELQNGRWVQVDQAASQPATDPELNNIEDLINAGHYSADGRSWRFARVKDQRDLAPLLRAFDIVVIREPQGGFQHNAAIHVLDVQGRLARALDLGTPSEDVARAAEGQSR